MMDALIEAGVLKATEQTEATGFVEKDETTKHCLFEHPMHVEGSCKYYCRWMSENMVN